jgi:hypothetical protein
MVQWLPFSVTKVNVFRNRIHHFLYVGNQILDPNGFPSFGWTSHNGSEGVFEGYHVVDNDKTLFKSSFYIQ